MLSFLLDAVIYCCPLIAPTWAAAAAAFSLKDGWSILNRIELSLGVTVAVIQPNVPQTCLSFYLKALKVWWVVFYKWTVTFWDVLLVVGRVHEGMSRNGKKLYFPTVWTVTNPVFPPATAVLTALFESGERSRWRIWMQLFPGIQFWSQHQGKSSHIGA